ncbi:hypothetical protein [Schleiferilactobacillus harbinensis]|uniref:hypothetical protein n=1 Tax=Schleiferilactobacillus harbinensis TaxID=304207 RepID=UPI00345ED728
MTTDAVQIAAMFIIGMSGLYYLQARPREFFSQWGNFLLIGFEILIIVLASYRLPLASDLARAAIAAGAIVLPSVVVAVWRWARERRRTAAHH